MVNEKKILVKFTSYTIFLAVLTAFFLGCASKGGGKQKADEPGNTEPLQYIKQIGVSQNKDASEMVVIEGDRTLTYSSIKQIYPLSVILHLPDTNLDLDTPQLHPESDVIDSVKVGLLDEKPNMARVEIFLKKDVAYTVERDEKTLRVVFAKADTISDESVSDKGGSSGIVASPSAGQDMGKPATRLTSVNAAKLSDHVKIILSADGPIEKYSVLKLQDPARIVFDIFNMTSSLKKEQVISVGEEYVKSVRYYKHPDKLRLVVDTKAQYLDTFKAIPDRNGLTIHVGKTDGLSYAPLAASSTSTPAGAAFVSAQPKLSKKGALTGGGSAWINRIEFASEPKGRSSVLIGTTQPVRYEVTRSGSKRVNLILKNAKVPEYRERPLITTRFESAVDRIMPVRAPSSQNDSMIAIEMREAVPYHVAQEGNLVLVHFEASHILPKPEDKASLPSWKRVLDESVVSARGTSAPAGIAAGIVREKPLGESTTEIVPEAAMIPEEGRIYTGKKISLDFYKTDIQNVFRILRDVSGKNFAVEKNVEGKVTLTLDKPVPWDQVLDLVLKMNQLGMVYEGDVIRVATLETLKAEEKLRKEDLAARQEEREKERSLEPLVTEYIPINYSNAEADIKAHLDLIITKDRGSVSVDKRTNQVIMVDVKEKIERAKAIVKKLDRVTPQVIIEARVVEASTNFAKELGTEWGVASEDVYNSDMKGEYGFDIAMNNSIETPAGSVGFNFSKLVGTPYVLNAKLTAMETQGEGKIISSPKIVTLDNKKATIKQGIEYPYSVVDDGDVQIEFKPIDLLLEVTPHVTMDNRISISIKITKNDIYQETSPPSLTTKEVTTELLINDGDTIVIGGIIKTNKRELERGFPILSKIPVLGYLFKSKTSSDEKEELLIFLTPSIVQLETPHV